MFYTEISAAAESGEKRQTRLSLWSIGSADVCRVKARVPDARREFGWYRGDSFVPFGTWDFLFLNARLRAAYIFIIGRVI